MSIIVTQKEEDLLDIDFLLTYWAFIETNASLLERETGMGISTLQRYQSHLR
ncbi:MAG: hypothetical protein GY781_19635 [Gammaproteobacteria bacterium]|nr:hypothetical protein [Gammaproteobacteria bacterium]